MERSIAISVVLRAALIGATLLAATGVGAGERSIILAAAPQAQQPPEASKDEQIPPEEKMRRRFPQPKSTK